jgi:bisphosphoglycerate-independent phosphoglycerate mutase (AlkP superfamily)
VRRWISRFFHSYNKMTTVHHKKKIHSNTLSIEEFKKIIFIQFRMQIINSLIYLFEEVKFFGFKKQIRNGEEIKSLVYKENLRKVFAIFQELFSEGSQDRSKIFADLRDRLVDMTETY